MSTTPAPGRSHVTQDSIVASWRPAPLSYQETAGVVLALSALTPAEQKELAECEVIVARGWQSFVETGKALARIRDHKLHRAQYDTFEAYCRARWQYGKSHTYRLIGAAELLTYLSPIGDIPVPSHEAQVRPLIGLPGDQAQTVWRKALTNANGRTVTAKLVKEALAEVLGRSAVKPASRKPPNGSSATAWKMALTKALRLLKEVQDSVSGGEGTRAALDLLAKLELSLQQLKRGGNGDNSPTTGTQRGSNGSSRKA
jgi:hypothetical protein